MTYPYSNEEITEIANEIAELFFGFATKSGQDDGWRLIDWYSNPQIMWEPFCIYAEKYSSITKDRGMLKEMLSREQIAIVTSAIKKAMIRASDVLRNRS